jgi:hypothetical protein
MNSAMYDVTWNNAPIDHQRASYLRERYCSEITTMAERNGQPLQAAPTFNKCEMSRLAHRASYTDQRVRTPGR